MCIRDRDNISRDRIVEKETEIENLKNSLEEKTKLYELEKERQEQILLYEKELDDILADIEIAQNEHNISELDEKIKSKKLVEAKLDKLNDQEAYYPLSTSVTSSEVKEIISKLSGMPKVKLQLNKIENLDQIRANMKEEFVGNDKMIDKIIDTYLISEGGLFERSKPIGSFLIGGKGAGKSYIAELTSKYLFDGETSLLRFDMGEFTEKSAVTKLIGAPPGYVGYEVGGILTEAIRTKPYSVVVFNNIEKANVEIQSLVSQILSAGKLKDNKGRSIDLKNTMIFLTTSENINNNLENDISGITNVVDYVFYLNELEKDSIDKLIKINLIKLENDLEDNRISLSYDDQFIKNLSAFAIEYDMDIREIKKFIEQEVYLEISKKILETKSDNPLQITLTFEDEKLNLTAQEKNWR